MRELLLRRPDDWHVHFRDGAMLQAVVPETARDFGRALVMPNLVPPVVTAKDALVYRDRILAAVPKGSDFAPQMTLYLTEGTDAGDVLAAHADGLIAAVKLYPAGATTNSASGVRDIARVMSVLAAMAEAGIPLCVHGEVTDPDVDIFDREAVFLDRVLTPLRAQLPALPIVLEHVTTAQGVEWVRAHDNTAGSITTHHLVINRNAILAGGIRPHYYCLPVAKRESHRQALRAAAASGDGRFHLGTDSAPHPDRAKLAPCGCAGCFTATHTMPILAQVFQDLDALPQLEAFTSLNGAAFFGQPPSDTRMRLVRRDTPLDLPATLAAGDETVTLFDPGFPLFWHPEAP